MKHTILLSCIALLWATLALPARASILTEAEALIRMNYIIPEKVTASKLFASARRVVAQKCKVCAVQSTHTISELSRQVLHKLSPEQAEVIFEAAIAAMLKDTGDRFSLLEGVTGPQLEEAPPGPDFTVSIENKTLLFIRIVDFFEQDLYERMKQQIDQHIGQQLKSHIKDPQGPPVLQAIILDLRGNPGGYVDEAIKVASLFLAPDQQTLLETSSRNNGRQTYRTDPKVYQFFQPLYVLTDHETASAAEVLAGILQNKQRAEVIGEDSYGKNSIQMEYPLSNGGFLYLTVETFQIKTGGRRIHADHHLKNEDDAPLAYTRALISKAPFSWWQPRPHTPVYSTPESKSAACYLDTVSRVQALGSPQLIKHVLWQHIFADQVEGYVRQQDLMAFTEIPLPLRTGKKPRSEGPVTTVNSFPPEAVSLPDQQPSLTPAKLPYTGYKKWCIRPRQAMGYQKPEYNKQYIVAYLPQGQCIELSLNPESGEPLEHQDSEGLWWRKIRIPGDDFEFWIPRDELQQQ